MRRYRDNERDRPRSNLRIIPFCILGLGAATFMTGNGHYLVSFVNQTLDILLGYLNTVDAGPANNMLNALREAIIIGKQKLPEIVRQVFNK